MSTKKLLCFLILCTLASTFPVRLVRMTVYNFTGEDVMIRLEGIITGQFYYLTIPPATRDNRFQPKVYTIVSDYYRRTTWACGGIEASGQIRVVKNFRMTFSSCGTLTTPVDTEIPDIIIEEDTPYLIEFSDCLLLIAGIFILSITIAIVTIAYFMHRREPY